MRVTPPVAVPMREPIYLRLEDATALMYADGTKVQTSAQYLGWQLSHLQNRGIARRWEPVCDPRLAYVNHGRWLIDCWYCDSGCFTHPEWRIACCAECGATYYGVEFPENLDEVTRLLLLRPKRTTQNWSPGESVLRLKAENLLHKLAS